MEKQLLQRAFERVSQVVDPKAALFQTKCARWENNKLTGTNLQAVITVELESVAGPCLINPQEMLAKLKAFSDCSEVLLSRVGSTIRISSGARKASIPVADVQDFPALPTDKDRATTHPELSLPIKCVLPAASSDETRPHLSQVRIDRGHVVATDGHRVHAHAIDDKLECSIPLRVARIVSGEPTDWIVSRSRVTVGDLTWIQPGDAFPPWEQVIPATVSRTIAFSRDHALTAIKAVITADRDNSSKARLSIRDGSVQLATDTAEDSWDADTGVGKDLLVGINAAYLLEAIQCCPGSVIEIRMGADELAPIHIVSEKFQAVVMPCRV